MQKLIKIILYLFLTYLTINLCSDFIKKKFISNDILIHNKKNKDSYPTYETFTIEIPKIKLNKHLFKQTELNDVNKNIEILKESDMPDVPNGNLILAAHSGNSSVSYFKNIHKLKKEDDLFIKYNQKQYEYKLKYTYDIEKTGIAQIIRNPNKNTLTLITCIEGTNKQLIIIAELSKISDI